MFSRETCSCLQFQRQYTSAVAMCVRCEIKDRIVFTCTVTGSGALLWAVESLFSFNDIYHEPGTVPDPFPKVFNVTLVNSVQNSTHPGRGNLTSEITILVTFTTLGKHVYCSDGNTLVNNSPSIEIQSAIYTASIHIDSVNVLMSETHSQIS